MFVIVLGNAFEGIQNIIGPFTSREEAEDYGNRILNSRNLGHHHWFTKKLELPNHA